MEGVDENAAVITSKTIKDDAGNFVSNSIAVATRRCCISLIQSPTSQEEADHDMTSLFDS